MNLATALNFNFTYLSDWGLLLVFLAVAFVYGLVMGKGRLVLVMLGVYFSFIITRFIPWKNLPLFSFQETPSSTVLIFIFLALVIGFYFLLPSSAFRSALKGGARRRSGWWQILALSFLQIGLILNIIISFLPAKVVGAMSPLAQIIFANPLAYFLWLILPITFLMLMRSRGYEADY